MGVWWGGLLASLLWVTMVTTRCLGQSGDSGDWGSGFDVSVTTLSWINATSFSQEYTDGPGGSHKETRESWVKTPPPTPQLPQPTTPPSDQETKHDECSFRFSTSPTSAERLKTQSQDLANLKAIQHGHQAVVENLVQYIGAELSDQQSYEDIIKENIAGIREEHIICDGVVQKVAEDLEGELEGDVLEALAGIQRIKDGSQALEALLQTAADVVARLETKSLTLQASFTKQLKDSQKMLHR